MFEKIKTAWCSLTHGGGRVCRDTDGRINWQCAKCGRWSDYPVDKGVEACVVNREISSAANSKWPSMDDDYMRAEGFEGECGLTPDGHCALAGTVCCDWFCGALTEIQIEAMKSTHSDKEQYMHIKIEGGKVERYSIAQLRADNRKTSFPDEMQPDRLAEYGVYPVTITPRPDTSIWQRAAQDALPTQAENGEWVLGWTITDFTAEQIEAEVRAEADRRSQALVAKYRRSEQQTFDQQVKEAEALSLDPDAPAPFLRARAAASGFVLVDLAASVQVKAEALASAVGAIHGKMDAILAMEIVPENFLDDAFWA